MNIQIVTPASERSMSGNRVTAERWATILKNLGHRVSIVQKYDGRSPDMLIALHARHSQRSYPECPLALPSGGPSHCPLVIRRVSRLLRDLAFFFFGFCCLTREAEISLRLTTIFVPRLDFVPVPCNRWRVAVTWRM